MNVHGPDHPMRKFVQKRGKLPILTQSCWHCRHSSPTDVVTTIGCSRLGADAIDPTEAETCDDFFDSRCAPIQPPGQERR